MQDAEPAAEESLPLRSTETADSREGFYLRLIGLSAVRHSSLDYVIRLLISKLAVMKSSTGETVTKDLSTSKLLTVVERLTGAKVPSQSPLHKSLCDFITQARHANRRRNDVLHGLWVFDPLGCGQRAKQMKTTQPADLEQLPTKELEDLKLLNRDLDKLSEVGYCILHQLEEE